MLFYTIVFIYFMKGGKDNKFYHKVKEMIRDLLILMTLVIYNFRNHLYYERGNKGNFDKFWDNVKYL